MYPWKAAGRSRFASICRSIGASKRLRRQKLAALSEEYQLRTLAWKDAVALQMSLGPVGREKLSRSCNSRNSLADAAPPAGGGTPRGGTPDPPQYRQSARLARIGAADGYARSDYDLSRLVSEISQAEDLKRRIEKGGTSPQPMLWSYSAGEGALSHPLNDVALRRLTTDGLAAACAHAGGALGGPCARAGRGATARAAWRCRCGGRRTGRTSRRWCSSTAS